MTGVRLIQRSQTLRDSHFYFVIKTSLDIYESILLISLKVYAVIFRLKLYQAAEGDQFLIVCSTLQNLSITLGVQKVVMTFL